MGQQQSASAEGAPATIDNEFIAAADDIIYETDKLSCLTRGNEDSAKIDNRSNWIVDKVRNYFWTVTDYFLFRSRKRKMVDVENATDRESTKKKVLILQIFTSSEASNNMLNSFFRKWS
jgi:hypothetical protein